MTERGNISVGHYLISEMLQLDCVSSYKRLNKVFTLKTNCKFYGLKSYLVGYQFLKRIYLIFLFFIPSYV